jgi:predicted phage terminase large subunit-like protein
MVVAPTFGMLSDSTFRSFLAVAEALGVVRTSDVKKSAPPAIKLRTGTEVLFRSGDDPAHLYGPNLSGIWLDEASIMPLEVFNVAIGRLREAGEQGWLSATFTPKGKTHWTYEVFATGRPDTELIHCRTAENPFLPPAFAETVGRQYTSRQSLQELEGQFLDAEAGEMFGRGWFQVITDVPKIVRKVRAWDFAATPKERTNDPDYTAGALLGRAEDGSTVVLDVYRLRGRPQQVEAAVRQTAELDGRGVAVWMEQEPGSAGAAVIDHYARHVLCGYNFRSERFTGNKATRAAPLAAAAERGLVKLLVGHWNKDFLDELEVFPYGGHDDQVDAASLAFNKLAVRQQFWMRYDGITYRGDRPERGAVVIENTPYGKTYPIPADR